MSNKIAHYAEEIATFCKSAKVSKAKAEEFVGIILAKALPENVGRPVSEKMQKIRDGVMAYAKTHATFTTRDIADEMDVEEKDVKTAIAWHNRDTQILFVVGTKEMHAPGRRPSIWSLSDKKLEKTEAKKKTVNVKAKAKKEPVADAAEQQEPLEA